MGLLLFLFLATLMTPLALHADDVKATIAACGKPTQQHAISDDDTGNSRILYYQPKGVDLIYDKVDGQWRWKFADDHQQTVLFSDAQLLYRMPCMEKIVAASNARDQAEPATPVETTPAGSGNTKNEGGSGLVIFAGVLILIVVAVGVAKEKNRKALAALPDVPVKCTHCGSTQVHAGARGFKLTTGFIGSGKVRLTCLRCGRRFKPGQGG